MQKRILILLLGALFLMRFSVFGQDSTKPGAGKQINRSSGQADHLYGKKIQQQSLTDNRFEKLDTVAANKKKKKIAGKHKRKHAQKE